MLVFFIILITLILISFIIYFSGIKIRNRGYRNRKKRQYEDKRIKNKYLFYVI